MKATPVLRRRIVRAAAALLVIAVLSSAAWYGYDAVLSHPIRQVAFTGSTQRLAPAELDSLARAIESAPGRPSLESVREAARRIRWVRDAAVRRVSADTIEIRFEAHEPLARWNDEALVSRRGDVFAADFDGKLPTFRGGEGAAPKLTREYALLAAAAVPLESPIAELRLSPRGAWQATLESGLVLELGRSDMEARLARLAAAWPELRARGVSAMHADLRYPNGFALRTAEKEKKKAT